MLFIYLLFCIVAIAYGNNIYHKLINPISIYTVVWALAVTAHESGLIIVYELSWVTWIVIFLSHLIFCIGCRLGTRVVFKRNQYSFNDYIENPSSEKEKKLLKRYIIITTAIAAIAIIGNYVYAMSIYGSDLLVKITDIYYDRVSKGVDLGRIPYLGSFINIAVALIGIYIGNFGFSIICVPAIVLVLLQSLTSGGRAGIVFCLMIMGVAFILSKRKRSDHKNIRDKKRRKRTIAVIVIACAALFVALVVLSNARMAGISMPYATEKYKTLFGSNTTLYTFIEYFAGPIGVLNEYLKECEFHFGKNTFLTIYNILSKIGVIERIDNYQSFYTVPFRCNVGTWLREIIEDFSIAVAPVIVLIFGAICSNRYEKCMKYHHKKDTIIASVLLMILALSFFDWKLRNSSMWISLLFGYFIGKRIDRELSNESIGLEVERHENLRSDIKL